jgi:cytochrome bd-type quinol oxidase subunit 2
VRSDASTAVPNALLRRFWRFAPICFLLAGVIGAVSAVHSSDSRRALALLIVFSFLGLVSWSIGRGSENRAHWRRQTIGWMTWLVIYVVLVIYAATESGRHSWPFVATLVIIAIVFIARSELNYRKVS